MLEFFARRAIILTRLETELGERRRSEAEHRTAKEKAERANAAKFEFLAPASHELRNPLSSIKGSLGFLVDSAVEGISEKSKEILAIANRNTDRLTRLVNDILDMERIETGKLEYNFTSLSLDNLVTEVIVANSGYAEEYGVKFLFGKMDADTRVRGDGDRLTQVVANLFSNAAKFSPVGDNVEITVTSDNGTARVSIADKGASHSSGPQRAHLRQIHPDGCIELPRERGTGLGLNISKSIIEGHGGTIGFDSEFGVGSTFFFTLPVAH